MNKELKIKVDKWFSKNYNYYLREVRNNIATGIMAEYCDDLCAFMYMEFMKQSDERVEQMLEDNKIMNWMLRSTSFQLRSGTSPFYTKYRSKRKGNVPMSYGDFGYDQFHQVTLDDYYECTMECLANEELLNFYQRKIVEMKYLQQMTYQEIVDEYGFSHISLKKHLDGALDIIEEYCTNKIEK